MREQQGATCCLRVGWRRCTEVEPNAIRSAEAASAHDLTFDAVYIVSDVTKHA
jgi:hypothetical protein